MKKTKKAASVAIRLPKLLVDEVNKRLGERGSDVQTYLRMQLRAFRRSKSILGLQDTMPFGKYRDEKVEDIVRTDGKYVTWVIANSDQFKFEPEVLELLEELEEA